jgi:hypothetical protein
MNFGGHYVDPMDYTSLDFSDEFKAVYGTPLPFFSAFKRLMTTEVSLALAPIWTENFVILSSKVNFLDFCNAVDRKAQLLQIPVLGRRQMEALWAQKLFDKFNHLKDEDIESSKECKLVLKTRLAKLLQKRYSTVGIARYWAEKPSKFQIPGLDIQIIFDDGDEAPESLDLDLEDGGDEHVSFKKYDEVDDLADEIEDMELPQMSAGQALQRLRAMVRGS